MNSLKPILQLLRNEWEALTLAVLAIILLLSLVMGFGRMFASPDSGTSGGGATRLNRVFPDSSFDFLKPDQRPPSLGQNHAFYTVPPRGWKAPRSQETVKFQPPKEDDKPTQKITGPEEPPIDRVIKKPTPPQPQPKDFLTYKGYMSSPSGGALALITHEHQPGQGTTTSRSAFLQSGDELLGLKVDTVDPELLILTGEEGDQVRLHKGKRVRLKKDQD